MLGTKIIPVTDFVRNFGEESADILAYESFLLTKGGRPYMTVKAAPFLRRDAMKKYAGALNGTKLDNDAIWKEVFKRKSRKSIIKI